MTEKAIAQNNGKCLTGEAIIASEDLPRARVEVPEWGGYVFVRAMTVGERERWQDEIIESGDDGDAVNTIGAATRLCAMTIVDERGVRLFTDEHTKALSGKNAAPIIRLAEAAVRVSGLDADSVEEMAGNSERTGTSSSSSASPKRSGARSKS